MSWKKFFDFFGNHKVFEDAHRSGRGSWSVHRIQVGGSVIGDQGRKQVDENGWGFRSKEAGAQGLLFQNSWKQKQRAQWLKISKIFEKLNRPWVD